MNYFDDDTKDYLLETVLKFLENNSNKDLLDVVACAIDIKDHN